MPLQVPGPGNPHGIYIYSREDRRWVLLRSEGEAFRVGELGEGVYVVYFDNLLCPACRSQDRHWHRLVEKLGGSDGIYFVVVLCDWFQDNCRSEAAARSFREHRVSASPTILVAAVKGGEVSKEYLEGVRADSVLEYYIKRMRGEPQGSGPPTPGTP